LQALALTPEATTAWKWAFTPKSSSPVEVRWAYSARMALIGALTESAGLIEKLIPLKEMGHCRGQAMVSIVFLLY
jgi:hypothetical protein